MDNEKEIAKESIKNVVKNPDPMIYSTSVKNKEKISITEIENKFEKDALKNIKRIPFYNAVRDFF